MSDISCIVLTPKALEVKHAKESNMTVKIMEVARAIISVLKKIGNWHDISNIQNIIQTQISPGLIYSGLMGFYHEIYGIDFRLKALLKKENFRKDYDSEIKRRASEIINQQITCLQREIFFNIVNVEITVATVRGEDGPAAMYPGIKNIKDKISNNFQSQTKTLTSLALEHCRKFRGIANAYMASEMEGKDKKELSAEVSSFQELEKQLQNKIKTGIASGEIDQPGFIGELVESFKSLKRPYVKKTASLKANPENVDNYEQKTKILEEGLRTAGEIERLLKMLKSLKEQLPSLALLMEQFAESQYQAKAVMSFFEEVLNETDEIFTRRRFESFELMGLLEFKLQAKSYMYQAICYYYALVQIEKDIFASLVNKLTKSKGDNAEYYAKKELKENGISTFVEEIHSLIVKMNERNIQIHMAFMGYKENSDLEKLTSALKVQIKLINSIHLHVKRTYENAQKLFFQFLEEDIGAHDFNSQFRNYLDQYRDSQEAQEVREQFEKLVLSKKKRFEACLRDFQNQFNAQVEKKKINLMAFNKLNLEYQKELLSIIQKQPVAQRIFVDILKDFIVIQKDSDQQFKCDIKLVESVKQQYSSEIDQFTKSEMPLVKILLKKHEEDVLNDREIVIAFLASNITLHEIESLSRLIPALPRNESQLDSPYGRFLLDVKSMFHKRLRYTAFSGELLIEKLYEKHERLMITTKICDFLRMCAMPIIEKINIEEKKLKSFLSLRGTENPEPF